jgi:hypothetical protein
MAVGSRDASLEREYRTERTATVRTACRTTGQRLRELLEERVPLHYEPGDMRREYRWTRAVLVGVATTLLAALAVRSVLTGLFVAAVSPGLSLVTLFNVGLTVAAVGCVSGVAAVRAVGRDRNRRRRRL